MRDEGWSDEDWAISITEVSAPCVLGMCGFEQLILDLPNSLFVIYLSINSSGL